MRRLLGRGPLDPVPLGPRHDHLAVLKVALDDLVVRPDIEIRR